jgi:hypothetical protein
LLIEISWSFRFFSHRIFLHCETQSVFLVHTLILYMFIHISNLSICAHRNTFSINKQFSIHIQTLKTNQKITKSILHLVTLTVSQIQIWLIIYHFISSLHQFWRYFNFFFTNISQSITKTLLSSKNYDNLSIINYKNRLLFKSTQFEYLNTYLFRLTSIFNFFTNFFISSII